MAYVYRHIRVDTNKVFYIGISKRDSPNYERAYNHDPRHRNKYWMAIYNKTPIDVQILFLDIPYDTAKQKEIEFIEIYGRSCDGGTLANLTKGGDGVLGIKNPKLAERNKKGAWTGKKHTEATKKKMSEKSKGRAKTLKQIEDSRKLCIENYQGVGNPNYKGVIYVYSTTGILITTCKSLQAIADYFNTSMSTMSRYINRRLHPSGYFLTRSNILSPIKSRDGLFILEHPNDIKERGRKKIIKAHTGTKMPPRSAEYREYFRKLSTGRKHTDETKLKMSMSKQARKEKL